jgi:isopentenyl-diphosphate Delta-isomerase
MSKKNSVTSKRKKEHLELCLKDEVAFKDKSNGFDNYEFEHYAITEVEIDKINFRSKIFKKKINFPFIISCMTGGTSEAENINAMLAESANELNIPLGVGSQRQALENSVYHDTYKILRKNASKIPILGNIGASQIAKLKDFKSIQFLVDLIEADAMVIHFNPAQELFQKDGEPNFKGVLRKTEKLIKKLKVPVIVKEVGSGISQSAAEKLLSIGVEGIDVAGAGGTSWTSVELLRNNIKSDEYFKEWGLPTSYCLKTISKLKSKFSFILIGSGGIYSGIDMAKSFALGADYAASARIILQHLYKSGTGGVVNLINDWFDTVKKIMFLTGSQNLSDLKKSKLILKKDIY